MIRRDVSASSANPQKFLKLLHLVAAVSTLLVLSLSALAIYQLYEGYAVSSAESEAIAVGESIVALERERLLAPVANGGGALLVISDPEIARLDQTLRRFLAPYGILKIKLFSPQGRVIYSTDPSIIGQINERNELLAIALSGQSVSILQTKERVYDLSNEARFDVDVVETYVPIRDGRGEVVGSFEIYQDITHEREPLVTGVVTSLLVFAAILGCVFSLAYLILRMAVKQLAETQEELRQLATLDSLTGLLNHREIIRNGEKEFARYQRQQRGAPAFSLIMADLDHFKALNDRLGHPEGDEALRLVAERLSSQMRRYSVVGRYGGEEFLVLLPEADPDEAYAVAERIRKEVGGRPLPLAGQEVKLTLSLGVATVRASDADFEAVLVRADQALYRAKEAGRDRVAKDV